MTFLGFHRHFPLVSRIKQNISNRLNRVSALKTKLKNSMRRFTADVILVSYSVRETSTYIYIYAFIFCCIFTEPAPLLGMRRAISCNASPEGKPQHLLALLGSVSSRALHEHRFHLRSIYVYACVLTPLTCLPLPGTTSLRESLLPKMPYLPHTVVPG